MRAMEVLWHWPRGALAVKHTCLIFCIFFGIAGPASAQLEVGDFVARDDGEQRLVILIEDAGILLEQQAIRLDGVDGLPETRLDQLTPARRMNIKPGQTIAHGEAGATTLFSVVVDPTLPSAAEQVSAVVEFIDRLEDGQSLRLIIHNRGVWLDAGKVEAGQTLQDLNLAPDGERPALMLTDYLRQDLADRHLVILADGQFASAEIGAAGQGSSTMLLSESGGIAESLPDGISALGPLETPETIVTVYDLARAGKIETYLFKDIRRMPFEGLAEIRISSGEIEETVTVDLPTYSVWHLINPINIPAWLTTSGRRWFGVINLLFWGAFGYFGYRLAVAQRREHASDPIAEIELFYEGRSVTVYHLPFSIGRAPDNDLVLDDMATSRHHAELRRSDSGDLVLVDLGSANGTLIDDIALTGPASVGQGLDAFMPKARLFIRPTPMQVGG